MNVHGSKKLILDTCGFYQPQETFFSTIFFSFLDINRCIELQTEVWGDKRGQDNLMMRWWEKWKSGLIDHQLSGRSDHGCSSAHRRSKGTIRPISKQLQGCEAAINHICTAGTAGGAHVEYGSVLSLQSAERSAADVKDIGSQISGEQHGVRKIKSHGAGHRKARASQGQNSPRGHESRR